MTELGHARASQRRALRIALLVNATFALAELAGGFAFQSLALLADAAHMLSDVAALGIALVAQRLVDRPATAKHTYGLQRAEVLGAQANAVLLLGAAGWIVYEALSRLSSPPHVSGAGLLAVASGGLVVNVASAVLLARSAGHSLNMRGALTHMVLDAAGSVAAIIAGIAIVVAGAVRVDAVASVVIAAFVVWGAWRLLSEAAHILLEGTPRHLDAREIESYLAADPAVEGVHHLHVWTLASDVPALSAHIVIEGERTLHQAQVEGDRLRTKVFERFGIEHTTFELECHDCDAPPDHTT
jgi:cobalt-zinc-cadmium efflux system protein